MVGNIAPVQAGSPRYVTTMEIDCSQLSEGVGLQVLRMAPYGYTADDAIPMDDQPIDNAYYSIQDDNGHWITFLTTEWLLDDNGTAYECFGPVCTSINRFSDGDTTSYIFPIGSTIWCVWCKEERDEMVAEIDSKPTVYYTAATGVASSNWTLESTPTVPGYPYRGLVVSRPQYRYMEVFPIVAFNATETIKGILSPVCYFDYDTGSLYVYAKELPTWDVQIDNAYLLIRNT